MKRKKAAYSWLAMAVIGLAVALTIFDRSSPLGLDSIGDTEPERAVRYYFEGLKNERFSRGEAEAVLAKARGDHPVSPATAKKLALTHSDSADPVKILKEDLVRHPELIPYEGTLGGTMTFLSGRYIEALGQGYVVADFEDGHTGGRMLVRYRVSNNGVISWRLIDAYPMNG